MRIVTAKLPAFIIFALATPAMGDCDREEFDALSKGGFTKEQIESMCQQTIEEILAGEPNKGDVRTGHSMYKGDIRPGHYTNKLDDSAYFESLGGEKYKISAWNGKARKPSNTDWYNSGKGEKQKDGRIHSTQPAVEGHPYQEYEFEGYWKILGPEKIELEKHRNYLKGKKPDEEVGWKSEGIIYTIAD